MTPDNSRQRGEPYQTTLFSDEFEPVDSLEEDVFDEPEVPFFGNQAGQGQSVRDNEIPAEEPRDDLLADHLAVSLAQEERGFDPVERADLIDERIGEAERAGVLEPRDERPSPRPRQSRAADTSIGRAESNGRFVDLPPDPAPNSPGKRSRESGRYVGDDVVRADPDEKIVRDRITGRFVVVKDR